MDADLQDDPNEILLIYKMINEDDKHIVSGWKKRDMIQLFLKIFLQNYLIGQQEKHLELN